MKGEIRSIRDTLDRLGPLLPIVVENKESEGGGDEERRRLLQQQEEDCSVEDVIALSTHCFDDGTELLPTTTLEFEEKGVDIKLVLSADVASTLNDDDTNINNNGEEEEEEESMQTQQKLLRPSGIPVFHVDTNKFPQVGAKNRIAGLPTLVLFYRGEELWRNEGMISGGDIVKMLIELQEGGWKKKNEVVEEEMVGGKVDEDEEGNNNRRNDDERIGNEKIMVTAGEVGKKLEKKTKKRKGRRLGG